MNGVTGTCFKRGFPRLPQILRKPKMLRDMHQRRAEQEWKHQQEEAKRRAISVAPVTASV